MGAAASVPGIISDYEAMKAAKVSQAEIEAKLVEKYKDVLTARPPAAPLNTRTVHVFHLNDVYNFDPAYKEEPIGGASRYATKLNALKTELVAHECKPMVVFSGDFVGPSLMSTVTQGAHMIDMLNYLEVDYATFGNHEFDYGYTSLCNRLRGVDDDVTDDDLGFIDYPQTHTKWIMTNMEEGKLTNGVRLPVGGDIVSKHVLVDWDTSERNSDGQVIDSIVKVGLIAVAEDWLGYCSQLFPGELIYHDYIETARAAAKDLRKQGAEIVLAITHNRLDNDYALTAAVPEIDLLLGGHDHFYKADLEHRIVKSGEEWRWASHIKIILENGNPKPIIELKTDDITADIPTNKQVDSFLDKYRILQRQKFGRTIYNTAIEMDPTEDSVRFKESAVCNWITDIMAEDYSKADGLQSADIAMIMGFPFAGKAKIPAGKFTFGDLMGMLPRPNTVAVLRLSGRDVIKSLVRGCAKLPDECGGLHHVSHRLSYTITVAKKDSGAENTVSNVKFDDKPIDLDHMYSVATTDEMAKGGYGYTWMKEAPRIVHEEYAMQIQDVVLMYCKSHMHADKNSTANPSMGRITINYL